MPEITPTGFLNIHKPSGMTSHDVIAKIRRQFKIKKVGHAGTLDPMATGVLVVCVGSATRLSEYAMASKKRYLATVHLGIVTDTYDAEGEVVAERPADHITRADVEAILPEFTGDIEQLPPMYSAIKQGGRKLYELARAGVTVERAPRAVTIETIELQEWSPPQFTLDVVCSPGTYIRSLAYDIGERLGVGAHLTGLVRTASGKFLVEDAISLETLLSVPDDWKRHLLPPDFALEAMAVIQLDEADAENVLQGRPVDAPQGVDGAFARGYTPDGRFIAILRSEGDLWRPHKVFNS